MAAMLLSSTLVAAELTAPASYDPAFVEQILRRLDAQEKELKELRAGRTSAATAPRATTLVEAPEEELTRRETFPKISFHGFGELDEKLEGIEKKLSSSLNLTGYYDFDYIYRDLPGSHHGFDQHHVSLHLSKELGDFRVFSEVEFEHGTKFEGDGAAVKASRGVLKMEQAFGEYMFQDQLTIRAGLILHPNYWNVNHYPNVVLTVRRPLIVRKIFPESLTGLMAYGTKYWGEFGVSYVAHLGNGEGASFTSGDDNDAKAVGGRFTVHVPTNGFLDTFNVGFLNYADRPATGRRTRTWGLESQIRKGRWELLAEFATRSAKEDRLGLYIQPSYRFNEKWAAYGRYDLLDIAGGRVETKELTVGVNFRPLSAVSLKLEGFHSRPANIDGYFGLAGSFVVGF